MNSNARTLSLIEALESELASRPSDRPFTATDLSMIDQLHTRGHAATVELASAVGITPDMRVLDLGSGLGGPARYLAETYGCRVDGVDATPGLVEAAKYLSTRWAGPNELVSFTCGDATSIPFPDATFDLVWMQHVAMNVKNRDAMYREIRRVLRVGGRLATYDVLRARGELIYPTPWASEAALSTVLSADETTGVMEQAGLRVVMFSLDTDAALAWVRTTAQAVSAGEPPAGAMMFRAALGENFREILGNLGKNYVEARADVAAIIAQRED